MTDSQVKQCTQKIKALGDVRKIAMEDTDTIIKNFHKNLNSTEAEPLMPDLTPEEKKKFARAEAELANVPEKRELDKTADDEAAVPVEKKAKVDAAA